MNTGITKLLGRGKQLLHEEGFLSFLKRALLFVVSSINKLFWKIAEKVLLSPLISKRMKRICRIYAVARLEKGLDPFIGGFYSRPSIATPPGHLFSVEVSQRNLSDIKRILDNAGIKFWLMFGTFLGAYRDKAIIPYDLDTDLAIYAEDLIRLGSCDYTFAREGFYLAVAPEVATLHRGGEHTDIYLFRPDGSKRVWRSIKYDENALEASNEIEFLGQKWRILSEPERWLRYTYGDDWRTPIEGKNVSKGQPYGI